MPHGLRKGRVAQVVEWFRSGLVAKWSDPRNSMMRVWVQSQKPVAVAFLVKTIGYLQQFPTPSHKINSTRLMTSALSPWAINTWCPVGATCHVSSYFILGNPELETRSQKQVSLHQDHHTPRSPRGDNTRHRWELMAIAIDCNRGSWEKSCHSSYYGPSEG